MDRRKRWRMHKYKKLKYNSLYVSTLFYVLVDYIYIGYPTPRLTCPPDAIYETLPGRNTATVTFSKPKTDVNWERDVAVDPMWARSGEVELTVGIHTLSFTAQHPLSKLSVSCSFSIAILGTIDFLFYYILVIL